MNTLWNKYLETMTKELGEAEAIRFTGSIQTTSDGSIEKAEILFYNFGRLWAPTIHLWGQWVKKRATHSTIAIILRDAKPLTELPISAEWKRLFLNRENCGIPDELSGSTNHTHHPLLPRYLASNGCMNGFTFIDSGCYGTIVRELHEIGFSFQPLFFFSKNPHIPGFLNDIGITERNGEILNDSLECAFPNIYMRPQEIREKHGCISVPLATSDILSIRFGNAALRGIREYSPYKTAGAKEEIEKLLIYSEKAQNDIFTGVLPSSSPEWSKKEEFLAHWPSHLSWV